MAHLLWLPVTCYNREQSRFELLQLADEQLGDVGLDREVVRREAMKPFWRA